ncbi:MAG: hypothetical protein LUI60_02530 [Clostridia bacterium]|nr:hypothetical protein [Clostridia bacterium]
MSVKIYMTSARGGAGCTTVAAGIGSALAASGERTLILDGDSVCGAALAVCGCNNLQVFTVADVESGLCRAKQAATQHPRYKNLYVMPTLGATTREGAVSAVREVQDLFDYIICDGAAAEVCDSAVVVTEPYQQSVKAADAKICALKDRGMKVAGVIVNKVNGGLLVTGQIVSPRDIAEALRVKLIAVIPEDLSLPLGKTRAQAQKYFKLAAMSLTGKGSKIYNPAEGYTGAGGYIKRIMRERI